MDPILGMATGAELVVVVGAATLVGTLLARCTRPRHFRKRPKKQIEIKVQRIDRPYRGRWHG